MEGFGKVVDGAAEGGGGSVTPLLSQLAAIDTARAGSCILGTEMAYANVDVMASAGFCVLCVAGGGLRGVLLMDVCCDIRFPPSFVSRHHYFARDWARSRDTISPLDRTKW